MVPLFPPVLLTSTLNHGLLELQSTQLKGFIYKYSHVGVTESKYGLGEDVIRFLTTPHKRLQPRRQSLEKQGPHCELC